MSPALRALLSHSINYAGLFPPASLELEPALKTFADGLRSDESWMLSGFVLPIGKFTDAEKLRGSGESAEPWVISALGLKTGSAEEFLARIKETAQVIKSASSSNLEVLQLEMPLAPGFDAQVLASAREELRALPVRAFWETSVENSEKAIALLTEHRDIFGFKLRTGGVTVDAFPDSAEIAQVMAMAQRHRLPIKFTAGLHHPVRMFREEVKTKMHGFLNVLGAGVLAFKHHWDQKRIAKMLEDEEPASFVFEDATFSWHDWAISAGEIDAARKRVTSFGSCSFDEPRADLRALNLL